MQKAQPPPDPGKVDFAALEILCLLHETRSFTRVAALKGVNQSAISYTVDKLRGVFADPLFVKQAGRQEPTARCDLLARQARGLLDQYEAMVAPEVFDPAAALATFVIACNYYERLLMIPQIARRIRRKAPGLTLKIVNSSSEGHQLLLDREADVLIGPFRRTESGFHFRKLVDERYVCLMDPDHPAARAETMTLERYLGLDHVLVTYGGSWKSRYVQDLERAGHRLVPAILVPSPAGIGHLVSGTTLVATVPERVAASIGRGQVTRPCPIGGSFEIGLVWTARTQASPIHRWVREEIIAAVAAAEAGRASGDDDGRDTGDGGAAALHQGRPT